MWSTNKKDRLLRSALLTIHCAANVAIVYIYLAHIGHERNINVGVPSSHFFAEKMTADECIPVCESKACMSHASTLLSYMDPTVHPCDNIHSFLCGKFKGKFGSEEKGQVLFENISPMLNNLKGILENIQEHSQSASAKMKTVYDSCVNFGSSELQGIIDFKKFLTNMGFLNWPNLLSDYNFSNISLPTILGQFIANGAEEYGQLIRMPTTADETDKDSLKLLFSSYSFKFDTDIPREAAVSIMEYFDLLPCEIETIINDHQLVRKSILNLYEGTGRCEENCSETFHVVNCSKDSDLDWLYLCETVETVLKIVNLTEEVITTSFAIEMSHVNFYKSLFPLLNSISDRSMANFMVLNFIKKHQDELNFYFRLSKQKLKHFNEVDRDVDLLYYQVDRWKYCVLWITKNMKIVLTNEVFHQYLTRNVTKQITDIYSDCSSDLYDMVTHQKWIPSEKKSMLKSKIEGVIFSEDVLSKGFPNDTLVDKIYEKFYPDLGSFFHNSLLLKKFANIRFVPKKYLNDQIFFALWKNFEIQASAMDPHLIISYGMLLPPFYIAGHKKLMNRMTLGAIIGHELGHIFLETLYETPQIPALSEKIHCVQDQFSRFKFEISNENLDGTQYDQENMPDNIGTAMIDKITEKYYSVTEEIILPGLSYTMEQLLYMSASQMWCSKSNLEEEMQHKSYNGSGMHSPQEFRILASLQNSNGFSKAFHCPDGSFMNPADKCALLELH